MKPTVSDRRNLPARIWLTLINLQPPDGLTKLSPIMRRRLDTQAQRDAGVVSGTAFLTPSLVQDRCPREDRRA
jgi:hypothetical protein